MWKQSCKDVAFVIVNTYQVGGTAVTVKHNHNGGETGKPRNTMMAVDGLLCAADELINRIHLSQVSLIASLCRKRDC